MKLRFSLNIGLLVAAAALLLPNIATALDQKVTIAQVSFHISHPAKEYDAKLLAGGASATAYFDPSDISKTSVDVTIKVQEFNSDNEKRDSHMLEVLEGIIFPDITWKGTATGASSAPFTAGTHEFRVKGPLTIHGVSRELEIPVRMQVAENGLVDVTSTFSLSLDNFEIERPSLVFVKIADVVPVTVRMVFPAGPKLLDPEWPDAPPPTPAQEEPDSQDGESGPPAGEAAETTKDAPSDSK